MTAPTRGHGGSALRFSCVAAEVLAAAVILVATLVLPWASYRSGRSSVVALHVGGTLAAVLGTVATLAIIVGALQIRWRTTALAGVQLVVGPVALVLCVVATAGRISHANSITVRATAATATAFGVGSGLAVLAGLVLVCAAVVVLALDSPRGGDSEAEQLVLVGSGPPR